jgi:hypothetical protein
MDMTPKISSWHGFRPGDRIVMLIETMGEMPEGGEITYPPGTAAVINGIDWYGGSQGHGVTVVIGDDEDRTIVNVFDDGDARDRDRGEGTLFFFRRAQD